MQEIFKTTSVAELDAHTFNDNVENVYIHYCTAIAENKLLSVADGNIFVCKGTDFNVNSHYLLKVRMQNYELNNMVVLCNGNYLFIECSDDFVQVTVTQIGYTKLHKVFEFDCAVLNKESKAGYVERLVNIILPIELQIISTTGKFIYSCDYDEYLSLI